MTTFDGTVTVTDSGKIRIRLNAPTGAAWLGGNGNDGDVVIFGKNGDNQTLGKARIYLDGDGSSIYLGGNGQGGHIYLLPSSATNNSDKTKATVHLDGNAGDIQLTGADCAEEFAIADDASIGAGSVLVVDADEKLAQCETAYDRRVAGVVSGAGPLRPGIVLGRETSVGRRVPVALVGKTYCNVDAAYNEVAVGDLLTTSPTPGCAMKAVDRRARPAPCLEKL